MTSMMVPNMFFSHLEQLLSSIHCSKRLYLEIAVKFSSQEHGRPPRIQEEKSGLDTKKSKSRLDFNRKQLPTQYWTSKKLRNGPEIMLFQPILEGKFSNIFDECAVSGAWTWAPKIFWDTLDIFGSLWNDLQAGTLEHPGWPIDTSSPLSIKSSKLILE